MICSSRHLVISCLKTLKKNWQDDEWLFIRAILCPKNAAATEVNEKMSSQFQSSSTNLKLMVSNFILALITLYSGNFII